MAADFDGFFFGTPVHWAASDGFLTSFLSRAFFVCQNGGVDTFYLKPAAGVVSARRAGTTSTWDQINKYFGILEMPIVTSQYWNQVHGRTPRRSAPGHRRYADHAHARQKYGLYAPL